MTEEQKEIYKNMFSKYGSYTPDQHFNTTLHLFQINPETMEDLTEIEKGFTRCKDEINRLKEYINMLEVYNIALAERYNFLSCCDYEKIIRLKRHKQYNGKVFYYLYEINRNKTTQAETITNTITYKGTERKNAIQDYNFTCAANPGAIYEMDINKGKWEK